MQKPQQTSLKFWNFLIFSIFERFVWFFLLFVGILQKKFDHFPASENFFLFFFADNSFDSALIGKYN